VNITLRPYHPDDFQTLLRIDRACYEPGIAYDRRELREYLQLPGSRCWVALLDEEIVGFLIAVREDGRGHIITIDVVESTRRHGVGSALLAEAERKMALAGIREVELETATNNQSAIAFWQNHGYRIVALYPGYYLGRIDAYIMTKRL
jgi:ribosomal protein S18 acetylase RimI-like enzyme